MQHTHTTPQLEGGGFTYNDRMYGVAVCDLNLTGNLEIVEGLFGALGCCGIAGGHPLHDGNGAFVDETSPHAGY